MKTLFALSALACAAFVATAADETGFKPLFNGKDLTGWSGNPNLWSVEDETIKGVTRADPKLTHNTFLVWTNGDVADFELRFSYKIVAGNSGVQYRSKVLRQGAQGPIVGGYQADFEAGKTYSGILYEEQGRGILAQRGQKTVIKEALFVTDTKEVVDAKTGAKKEQKTKREVKADSAEAASAKPEVKVQVAGSVGDTKEIQAQIKHEEWNDYVIIAKGNHLQHFINGVPTIDVTDEQEAKAAKSGVLALQIHTGPPMTVQFKNLRMKNLGKDSAAADTMKKFTGKWAPTAITMNGMPVEREQLDAILLTIDGHKYTSKIGDRLSEGTLKVDESKSPAVMDVLRTKSDGETATIPAIYEMKGDTLIVCYAFNGGERPKEFKSETESGVLLVTYQRE